MFDLNECATCCYVRINMEVKVDRAVQQTWGSGATTVGARF